MDKPIRVLHVVGIMNRGGTETLIMTLYRKINRTKVQFDFVENSDGIAIFDKEIEMLGGRIFHCPHFNGKNYFQYKRWWKNFFDEHSHDIAIVHGHIGSTAAIYLAEAKKHGIYTIAHSHSTNRLQSGRDIMYAILSFRTRYIADHLFGCSTEAGKSRYGKHITKDERYENLPNAIAIENFLFDNEIRISKRKELHIGKNECLIGTVGRLTEQKNPEFVFKIFKQAIKMDTTVKCIWVGTGELKETINDWIKEAGLEDRIIMTGVRSDIPQLLQAMDCFVFPSLCEGLGIAAIEAQASGIPCILANTIPNEAEVTELVEWHDLSETADSWAAACIDAAKKASNKKRISPVAEIRQAGYDASETAHWLEDFYVSKCFK